MEASFLNVGFIAGDRLGDGAEGVKINFAFSFEREGKGPISLGKMREKFLRAEQLAESKIEFLRGENGSCERLPWVTRYLA